MVIATRSAVTTTRSGDVSRFLSFRFCNIISIFNKSPSVKLFCSSVDITGLVETRDCPDYADNIFADLRSFNVFRRARDRHGGGVASIVSKALRGYRRSDLEHRDLELLMVDISTSNIIVCVFYSPPVSVRVNTVTFVEHIRSLSHDVIQRLIVLGDFNVPGVDWESRGARSVPGHALLEATREFSFKQIIPLG